VLVKQCSIQLLQQIQGNLLKSICNMDPQLLLSVYDKGSLSYYKLHGAGVGVLNVLLICSYVTVRTCIIVHSS
jgi:hypothetical protein